MESKKEAITEENGFAKKLSDIESKNEANNTQNNTEPNYSKEYPEKDEEIGTNNLQNKNGEVSNTNQEKGKEVSIDIFDVKGNSQEDIKISPLQEMELQQSNNDTNINKVKAKKKIIKKRNKIFTEKPKWKKSKKTPKIKNAQNKCSVKNYKRNKTNAGKKRFRKKRPKKVEKAESNDLNDDGNAYLYNCGFLINGFYINTFTPIYPWDIPGFKNMNDEISDDEKLDLGKELVEVECNHSPSSYLFNNLGKELVECNHSPSSDLFNNNRFPTINYGDYDDGLNIGEFGNENDNTNYKTEEDQ